jgi:hypothetical protein
VEENNMRNFSKVWLRCGGVALMMFVAVSAMLAQATRQPAAPSWKTADQQLAEDAQTAYEAIKPGLLKLDYAALARTIADNREPLLLKDRQTEVAIAKTADKLKANAKDIERTRQLLVDVEALRPSLGPAMMQEARVRNVKVTLVKIPLRGTRELAEKNRLRQDRWNSDDEGNLAILMVKHKDTWYWNPFGW